MSGLSGMYLQEIKNLFPGSLIRSFLMSFILLICSSLLFAQTEQIITSQPLAQSRHTTTYGPIIANEGLWRIAEKLNSGESTSVAQMALAIFRLNPAAFSRDNMNGLLVGSVLNIPDVKEGFQVSRQEALMLVKQHWQLWQTTKTKVPETVPINDMVDMQFTVMDSVDEPSVNKQPDSGLSQQKNAVLKEAIPFSQVPQDSIFSTSDSTSDSIFSSAFIEQFKKISFLDYFRQMEWYSLEQMTQGYKEIVNFDYKQIDFSVISNWFKATLLKSPIVLILFGFSVFVCLVWFFRKQEKDINLIESQLSDISRSALNTVRNAGDEAPVVIKSVTEDLNKYETGYEFTDEELNIFLDITRQERETFNEPETETDIFDVAHDQVDINKFLHPEAKKSVRKRKNLLEAAFDKDMFSHGVGFIQEETVDTSEQSSHIEEGVLDTSMDNNILDSVAQIKFVNDSTRNSKVEAFLNITQSGNMTDDELINEFSNFKDNDKIDVFIAEFEEIMANLSRQTPAIEKSPDELENIVQFKLSVHFIKVLSDMMHATHLNKFSNTVIDFLEDILDGKTKMSNDVSHRLMVVVGFYNRYIHFVKSRESYKA